ncbi:MAG TPA: hypothetical protein VM509_01780 [Planctomycetota bacterium]|nr:hypothetical protein [Planctomycetota bacterium]
MAKSKAKSKSKSKAKGKKRSASKRELIAPRGDKRFVRRGKGGEFKESDDVSSSLSADRRRKAKKKAKRGQGDRGDE